MAISALQYQKNSISQMPASFRRYIYTKLNPGNKERKKKQGNSKSYNKNNQNYLLS